MFFQTKFLLFLSIILAIYLIFDIIRKKYIFISSDYNATDVLSQELNTNLNLSVLSEAKALKIQLIEASNVKIFSDFSDFEAFLSKFNMKFQGFFNVLQGIMRIKNKIEGFSENSLNSIEKAKECRRYLYSNKSVLGEKIMQWKILKSNIEMIKLNISLIDNELYEYETTQIRLTNAYAHVFQANKPLQKLINPEETELKVAKLKKIERNIEEFLISIEKSSISYKNKSLVLSEKRAIQRKINEEIEEFSLSLEIIGFDLKEQELQDSLIREMKDISLNDKIQASQELASYLKSRIDILTEMILIEKEENIPHIKAEINEIKQKYEELLDLSNSFEKTENISNYENFYNISEKNLEIELLELNSKILRKNQEKQHISEEIENVAFSMQETELYIESIKNDIKLLENEKILLENEKMIEIHQNEQDLQENIKEKHVYNEKTQEIMLKTRELAEKRTALELIFEGVLSEIKVKYEHILINRKEFIDLLQECDGKQRLMRLFIENSKEFLKELSPLLKNLEETRNELNVFLSIIS